MSLLMYPKLPSMCLFSLIMAVYCATRALCNFEMLNCVNILKYEHNDEAEFWPTRQTRPFVLQSEPNWKLQSVSRCARVWVFVFLCSCEWLAVSSRRHTDIFPPDRWDRLRIPPDPQCRSSMSRNFMNEWKNDLKNEAQTSSILFFFSVTSPIGKSGWEHEASVKRRWRLYNSPLYSSEKKHTGGLHSREYCAPKNRENEGLVEARAKPTSCFCSQHRSERKSERRRQCGETNTRSASGEK